MALYSGSQKLCPTITINTGNRKPYEYFGILDANGNLINSALGIIDLDLSDIKGVQIGKLLYYKYSYSTTIKSVNLSNLTNISGDQCCAYMFTGCINLNSIDLSSLTNIEGEKVFYECFWDCSNLTTVDLSSLTNVSGTNAFQYAFDTCTGLSTLYLCNLTYESLPYFSNALYGTNGVTIYVSKDMYDNHSAEFLNMVKGTNHTLLYFSSTVNFDITQSGTVVNSFISDQNGNSITGTSTITAGFTEYYIVPNIITPTIIYREVNAPIKSSTTFNIDIELNDLTYKQTTVNITNVSDATISIYRKNGTNIYQTTGSSLNLNWNKLDGETIPDLTLKIEKSGYRTVTRTISYSDDIINVTLEASSTVHIVLNASNSFNSSYLTYNDVVDGTNFEIVDGNLRSGSASYNVNNGKSKGYMKFTAGDNATLTITAYTSSEANYDFGCAYLSTNSYYYPTSSAIKNSTTDGYGSYVYRQAGANTEFATYTAQLESGQEYYLSLVYAKDSIGNKNLDRMFVSEITIDVI